MPIAQKSFIAALRRLAPAALLLLLPQLVQAANEKVQVWKTTSDLSSALSRQDDLLFAPDSGTATYTLKVDQALRYQQMDGFGLSLTDSSSFLLRTQLTEAKRVEVMNRLFGKDGISMSLLRQPMGSCDFNRDVYSYDETPGDTNLDKFSVARDEEVMIPAIQEALAINPSLRVMSSPWSPPGWMKTSGSMIGGNLKPENYPTMAKYFVKYVQAYAAHNIPIWAVTPQNEPGYIPAKYPGCGYAATAQATFIRDNLGPAFRDAGLSTKIMCFDHNYDDWSIPLSILADTDTRSFTAGSAFHHYGGTPSMMSSLHDLYPAKDIWFTEGGIGDWNNTFDNIAHEMIAIPRNWAKSIILWNAALDPDDLPALIGKNNTNQGMVTIRSDTKDSVTYNEQYYYLGHLSKFVAPGAWRVDSPNWEGTLETVAFENADGTLALVVLNRSGSAISTKVVWKDQSFLATVPAKSLVTYSWGTAPKPVTITTQPVNASADAGNSVSFRVEATGTAPLSYQWYKGDAAVTGATDPILALYACALSDAGSYHAVVTNPAGPISSATVTLAVATRTVTPGANDRLSNISTRSVVGTDVKIQVAGFVIEGPSPKKILIRASGPALGDFGLTGVLQDPILELYSGQTRINMNDDWDSALTAEFSRLGAFGWKAGSKDAALELTLDPGSYTAQVSGKNGGTGIGMIEVYDADGPDAASHLSNISTRSQVDTGNNIQIAGFVIQGSAPRKILIRAAGPALTAFGLQGTLANPLLRIYSGQTLLFENNDWAPGLSDDFKKVGAFSWTSGSADAALVLTLPPGQYTAQVSGVSDGTGVGIIEVYQE
jgi:glucosylceramidase